MSHPTIKYEQIRGIAEGGGSSISSEESGMHTVRNGREDGASE